MSFLRSLSLPKASAVIAAGEFFCRPFTISHRLNISNLVVTPRKPSPFARIFHWMAQMETEQFTFGPYKINPSEVFYSTKLSYALVNLRPLLPGHVLVCPRRGVKRFADLTADETADLWLVAKEVGGKLERHHKASSLTFAIQDGPQAGQTVAHVHIHIIPRKSGDFEKNDEIYDAIDMKEKQLKESLDLDLDRKDRTFEEMAREAEEYRFLFT
ncbi:bifunctional bis(5'-adenosyl)-triphosphatase/adenylylsulfatase FHIT [Phalaenopsis equestris]|uniref:bifunctional bis(5'-adenosyl)-triphosphatase/adenylylsulfatase FHIT n=1 Tax=Phalaenopsis equestris TaxID=78828 RepID=UPI0009E434A5|nr:bifunctional bis(5'-adenosyl)-triphosphatase/adenylylsulfatase FHIT [Phalaenopsis equestris]